jgi:hypothetical protein
MLVDEHQDSLTDDSIERTVRERQVSDITYSAIDLLLKFLCVDYLARGVDHGRGNIYGRDMAPVTARYMTRGVAGTAADLENPRTRSRIDNV